ncbi:unnamed protein product, partial [Amoebophrya sp. A25]
TLAGADTEIVKRPKLQWSKTSGDLGGGGSCRSRRVEDEGGLRVTIEDDTPRVAEVNGTSEEEDKDDGQHHRDELQEKQQDHEEEIGPFLWCKSPTSPARLAQGGHRKKELSDKLKSLFRSRSSVEDYHSIGRTRSIMSDEEAGEDDDDDIDGDGNRRPRRSSNHLDDLGGQRGTSRSPEALKRAAKLAKEQRLQWLCRRTNNAVAENAIIDASATSRRRLSTVGVEDALVAAPLRPPAPPRFQSISTLLNAEEHAGRKLHAPRPAGKKENPATSGETSAKEASVADLKNFESLQKDIAELEAQATE